MSTDDLLPARRETERHERARVRRVGLVDGNERDIVSAQRLGDEREMKLVARDQGDRERPLRKPTGRTLSCSVDDLRCLHPARDVGAHNHVVRQRVRFTGVMASRANLRVRAAQVKTC